MSACQWRDKGLQPWKSTSWTKGQQLALASCHHRPFEVRAVHGGAHPLSMHPQNTGCQLHGACTMLTKFWLLVERSLFWRSLSNALRTIIQHRLSFWRSQVTSSLSIKRAMCLQHDGRLTIKTHHEHVEHVCELLKLNPKLQNKKAPGHSAMDEVDDSSSLGSLQAGIYRTCVGVLLYLAADLPHCQHVVPYLATYSTNPSERSFMVLKHLVGYLAKP